MAKVTIKLNLEKQEDLRDYNLYNNAGGMFDALFEISCNLKRIVEYQLETDDALDPLDLVFKQISEILESNNVIIDKLS